MEIEFYPAKSEWTRLERGFGFGFAARVFLGRPSIRFARIERGEVRMKAVGTIDGAIYTVIFVDEGDIRRIISARITSRKERKEWLASD